MRDHGTVETGDDRCLDIEQVHHELLAVPANTFPVARNVNRKRVEYHALAAEHVAGADHDDQPDIGVARQFPEQLRELRARVAAPHQRAAVAVEADFDQPVLARDPGMVVPGFHGLRIRRAVIDARVRRLSPRFTRNPGAASATTFSAAPAYRR